MKSKGQNTGDRRRVTKPDADAGGLDAAARVIAAGGRVPKKFAKARPVSAGPTKDALEAQAKVSAARRVAFEILMLVEAGRGHSDELLRSARMDGLGEADAHLATALVMGVLRWQIALDALVKTMLARPDQRLAAAVWVVLRMGAFQLLHLDRIPAHAALNESVELCRAAGEPHVAGMVNAILRNVAGQKGKPTAKKIFETPAALAERLGHPSWMVERWVKEYGRAAAEAVCMADQEEPGESGLFAAGSGDGLPAIDAGSRLVAEMAAAAMPEVTGRAGRVWDCCAAPGGKTMVLAERLRDAEVVATDVSERRLRAMEGRLRAEGRVERVRTLVADAMTASGPLLGAEDGFDLVLCDVPCSGTGTLGRNPEIRLRLEEGELARQAERQRRILRAALRRVGPGGRLVYATCSLEPEENEQVVAAVAEGWRRLDTVELLGRIPGLAVGVGELVRDGALRTLPGGMGCDGFWAVGLERDSVRQ